MRTGRGLRMAPAIVIMLLACGSDSQTPTASNMSGEVCGPYPAWRSSEYVLPYPVGTAYVVSQANCSNGGHRGADRYAYDFWMGIGTLVSAARDGEVVEVVESFSDHTTGALETNLVLIEHGDGTVAIYAHLTQFGALVDLGQSVSAGDPVGLSGNSGPTGGKPHLHFAVASCPSGCPTLPVTFRNTAPNPDGLQQFQSYTAEPH